MVNSIFKGALFLLACVFLTSSNEEDMPLMTVGNNNWLMNNLGVTHFRNGEEIPFAKTKKDWFDAAKKEEPAWCYYKDDQKTGEKYGKLYNWYAVNDSRGIAPEGFRVATLSDWQAFKNEMNGDEINGVPLENLLQLGGYRFYGGAYDFEDKMGFWWTSDERDNGNAYFFSVQKKKYNTLIDFNHKEDGMYVKVIRE